MERQQTKDDCGVCCFAMLTGFSYEVSKALIFGVSYKGKLRTSTKDIIRAIKRKAIVRDIVKVNQKKLKVANDWSKIPDNSLVKIPHIRGNNWHWVAYRKGKIYDPARGVFKPSKFDKKPSSYLVIHKH